MLQLHAVPCSNPMQASSSPHACRANPMQNAPVSFHSVMDSPDRVSRVTPPITTMVNTQPAQPPSHHMSWRRARSGIPAASAALGAVVAAAAAAAAAATPLLVLAWWLSEVGDGGKLEGGGKSRRCSARADAVLCALRHTRLPPAKAEQQQTHRGFCSCCSCVAGFCGERGVQPGRKDAPCGCGARCCTTASRADAAAATQSRACSTRRPRSTLRGTTAAEPQRLPCLLSSESALRTYVRAPFAEIRASRRRQGRKQHSAHLVNATLCCCCLCRERTAPSSQLLLGARLKNCSEQSRLLALHWFGGLVAICCLKVVIYGSDLGRAAEYETR